MTSSSSSATAAAAPPATPNDQPRGKIAAFAMKRDFRMQLPHPRPWGLHVAYDDGGHRQRPAEGTNRNHSTGGHNQQKQNDDEALLLPGGGGCIILGIEAMSPAEYAIPLDGTGAAGTKLEEGDLLLSINARQVGGMNLDELLVEMDSSVKEMIISKYCGDLASERSVVLLTSC
jgi:hypothetical protein